MPCEAMTRCGSQVLCAKITFFFVSGRALEQNKGSQSLLCENLFCFLFSDPVIFGLDVKLV